jgi:hypothetical protein
MAIRDPPGRALIVGAVSERSGRDQGEPAGDLPSVDAGEQAFGFDVDTSVNKVAGNPFSEVARFRLWISSTSTSATAVLAVEQTALTMSGMLARAENSTAMAATFDGTTPCNAISSRSCRNS